jgi:hypothetical protein
MAAHCDGGASGWSGEEVPKEFANYGGLSSADGAQGDYSSQL